MTQSYVDELVGWRENDNAKLEVNTLARNPRGSRHLGASRESNRGHSANSYALPQIPGSDTYYSGIYESSRRPTREKRTRQTRLRK